jgi:hypothetical protein
VIAVVVLVASQLPINWHSVRWGTVPEWIGVAVLLCIAVGVWRHLHNTQDVRERERVQ